MIGLCGYGINRATLQEAFGISRLIGLCGYGIRPVVTNVDKRDILPGIIINELHELIPQTIIKEAWLCIKTEIKHYRIVLRQVNILVISITENDLFIVASSVVVELTPVNLEVVGSNPMV